MAIESTERGDIAIVMITDRLDSNNVGELEIECAALVDRGKTYLILDMSELRYISSAGLRVVLTSAKRLKTNNGKLALCSLQPMAKDVFVVSGLASYIPIFATREEALAAA